MSGKSATIIGSGRWLSFVWILLFALALGWLLRPVSAPQLPAGWSHWKQVGPVFAMIPFRNGVLTGGANGIWYIDDRPVRPFAAGGPPSDAIIHQLVQPQVDMVWVGHSKGLSILTSGKWSHYAVADGIPEPPLYAMELDAQGGWIGGEGGLIRFQGNPPWPQGAIISMAPSKQIPVHRISAILQDSYGGVWIGSNEPPKGGLFRSDAAGVSYWGREAGLPHPQVTSILQDQAGRIWAGTGFYNRGGVAVLTRRQQEWVLAKTLDTNDLAGPKVRSLAQDKQGRYWIGSENSGLAIRTETALLRVMDQTTGLPEREVTSIQQTEDGAVWLATLNGVIRIKPQVITTLTTEVKGGSS